MIASSNEQRIAVTLSVSLHVRGPILTQGSVIGRWGLDAFCARNAHGKLYIPGTQVKGKFREAIDQIDSTLKSSAPSFRRSRQVEMDTLGNVEDLHGINTSQSHVRQKNSQLAEHRNPYGVTFSDFVATGVFPAQGDQILTRVRIDPSTGTAQKGALRVLDCPVLPGQVAEFTGRVRFVADPNGPDCDEKSLRDDILSGLSWITGFGADQTVGYGRLLKVELKDEEFVELMPKQSRHEQERVEVELTFEDYLCFPNGVINGNVFESGDTISGGVILGAMAQAIKDFLGLGRNADITQFGSGDERLGLLCRHFNDLVVTNARPIKRSEAAPLRPTVAPFSLAWDGQNFCDMATVSGDPREYLFVSDRGERAPTYWHDWKDEAWDELNDRLAISRPSQELRIRTAIDSERRRAKDNNLFAYRGIDPDGYQWCCSIAIRNTEVTLQDRQLLYGQLEALLGSGWLQFGKNKIERERSDSPFQSLRSAGARRNYQPAVLRRYVTKSCTDARRPRYDIE